jgi:hypothetical protein
MSKNNIISLIILSINFALWFVEWDSLIGFHELRNDKLLWFPFGLFFFVSLFQFANEWVEDAKENQPITDCDFDARDHLKKIVSIASSVILAISILVSLHSIFNNEIDPFLKLSFLYSALVSFLWIFFGVFCTFSSESNQQILSKKTLLRIKSTALIHALGWASVCVAMIIIMLTRFYA